MIYELEGVGQFVRWQVRSPDGMSPLGLRPWVIYLYPHAPSDIRSMNLGAPKKCIGGLLVIF